ncbi:hypothetical protein ABZP36_009216 [Zizania latifolia]
MTGSRTLLFRQAVLLASARLTPRRLCPQPPLTRRWSLLPSCSSPSDAARLLSFGQSRPPARSPAVGCFRPPARLYPTSLAPLRPPPPVCFSLAKAALVSVVACPLAHHRHGPATLRVATANPTSALTVHYIVPRDPLVAALPGDANLPYYPVGMEEASASMQTTTTVTAVAQA